MSLNGTPVRGSIMPCHDVPCVFSSKTCLHATQPWTAERRLALAAWSTLSTPFHEHTCRVLQQEHSFPYIRTKQYGQTGTQTDIRQSIAASSHRNAQLEALGVGLVLQIDSSQEPGTTPNSPIPLTPPGPCEPEPENNSEERRDEAASCAENQAENSSPCSFTPTQRGDSD